jgi:hypothetical protein
MHLILLVVGLLVTAAGFVTIGFGIPINAFSLGNTLIVAGTTAVAAGLVLTGLSVAVRQLQRIAEAMAVQPAARASRMSENAEGLVPPTARIAPVASRAPSPPPPPMPPAPPRQPDRELRAPEPRQEPRFAAAPAAEPPVPLDWLRPRSKAGSEAAMMDVPDEAPLSPPAPARASFPPQYQAPEHEIDPKAYTGGRGGATGEPTPRTEVPRPEPRPMPRATPTFERQSERQKEGGLFDVLWPDSRSAPPEGQPRDPNLDASPLPPPPPVAPRIREEREAREGERRREPASPAAAVAPPAPPPPPSPAIQQSGVIDGMAYTLYADGSIEAELPQGTVKFASVDALRAHLEKSG